MSGPPAYAYGTTTTVSGSPAYVYPTTDNQVGSMVQNPPQGELGSLLRPRTGIIDPPT